LIQTENSLILIDCGISVKKLKAKLAELGITQQISQCFITHAHSDHLYSLTDLAKFIGRDNIYASKNSIPDIDEEHTLIPNKIKEFADYKILSVQLSHDDPCLGFVIQTKEEKIVLITDTGYVNSNYYPLFKDATNILIEANHDPEMLIHSSRPQVLINRILSTLGHLSNQDCGQILTRIVSEKTKKVVLLHLSQQCNTPNKALESVELEFINNKQKLDFELVVAKVDEIVRL
jgi:phosphoribosyl 1,2-cyclic phosphodiesterase